MKLHEEIAKTAYELYERSGKMEGRDEGNWHEAERIVRARYKGLERADQPHEVPKATARIIREEGEESKHPGEGANNVAPTSEKGLKKSIAIKNIDENSTGSQATSKTSIVTNERTMGTVGLSVKEGVVNSLGALKEIESKIMNIAKDTVMNSLTTAKSVTRDSATVTRDVVRGAVRATEEVGVDLATPMKYVAKGIIFGIDEVGDDIMAAAGHTAKSAVEGSAKVGGNIAVVARRTAEGILEATNEMGYDVEEAAILTIAGAMEAAGKIGNTASKAVKDLLLGVERNESRIRSGAVARKNIPEK